MAGGTDENSPDFVSESTAKGLLGDKIAAVRYEAKCKTFDDLLYQFVAYGFAIGVRFLLVVYGW